MTRFRLLLAVVCAGALTWAAASCGGSAPSSPSSSSSGGSAGDNVTITITPNGVTPANLVVKAGTQVTFVNNDTNSHMMACNPHPEHNDPECAGINDVGVLFPGERRLTGNLNVLKTCGYHDHTDFENKKWQGSIVIQ